MGWVYEKFDMSANATRPMVTPIKKIGSGNGELIIIDQANGVPFEPKRFFYAKGMHKGDKRGGHAHKKLKQFLWVIRGKFRVRLIARDSAEINMTIEDDSVGIYVPPMTWVEYWAEQEESICGVVASASYTEEDYIRNYNDFIGKKN